MAWHDPARGVYMIVGQTGRCYIGSSVNIQARFCDHRSRLNRGCYGNSRLQRAWNRDGGTTFQFKILETIKDVSKLYEHEQAWLTTFLPHVYNQGTVSKAPWLGVKRGPTPESVRAKQRAANAGRRFGSGLTERGRERQRQSRLGKPHPHTPAQREKILAAAALRRGVPMSLEVRQRMRLGWMKRKLAGKRNRPWTDERREQFRIVALAREAAKRSAKLAELERSFA